MDSSGNPTNRVTIAGVGTYELDPATGRIEFTPTDGVIGSNLTDQLARLGALSLILGLFLSWRRRENESQLITE